jgi:hypothetical protein
VIIPSFLPLHHALLPQQRADKQGRARYGPTASAMSNSTSLSPTPSGGQGEKARFGQDANMWNAGFEGMNPEADDYLHNPDPKRDRKVSPVIHHNSNYPKFPSLPLYLRPPHRNQC